jgi:hypothetical protein
MHPTTQLRARWHRAAGHHIVTGRAPSAAEISAALGRAALRAAANATPPSPRDGTHCPGCACETTRGSTPPPST